MSTLVRVNATAGSKRKANGKTLEAAAAAAAARDQEMTDAMRTDESESVVDEAIAEAEAQRVDAEIDIRPAAKKQRVAEPPSKALTPIDPHKAELQRIVAAKEMQVAEIEEADAALDDRPFIERFWESTNKLASLVNKDLVKVKNPDQALLLWSMASRKFIHFLELEPEKIKVEYQEQKRKEGDTKVGTGQWYINLSYQRPQISVHARGGWGLRALSCFGVPLFLRHGPTADTGIEGNRGRVINGSVVKGGAEQYQHLMTCKAYNPFIIDDATGANPMMQEMLRKWDAVAERIMTKALEKPATFTQARVEMAKTCKAQKKAMPSEPAELFAMMKAERFFAGKVDRSDDNDPQEDALTLGVSCYRTLTLDEKHHPDQLACPQYAVPNDGVNMFMANTHNEKGARVVHNDIPLFRCRRADEVVEGVKYDSPLIAVPSANAVLDFQKDVIAEEFHFGVYEWKLNKGGITNKPTAYIWLNTREKLNSMSVANIEPCNPRYAIPMAGYYKGPLGWEGTPPPEVLAEQAAQAAMQAANDAATKAAVGDIDPAVFD